MSGNVVNIEVVKKVANGLEELRTKMVFVGGATLSLYANDPAADPVRPTSDIDLSISLTGYGAWSNLQERLIQLRFYSDQHSDIMCRFNYEGLTVDVMPDDPNILGFTNRWYSPGLEESVEVSLGDIIIRILPVAYFLATKFEAYYNRGKGSKYCKDFEDIIYVVDNNLDLVEQVAQAKSEVKAYLKEEFQKIWDDPYRDENITCHLFDEARLSIVESKIKQILALTC